MIRDETTAKSAISLMENAHALLMDSLKLVQKNCDEEEYKEFSRGMAHVLGHLYFLVMEPIYAQHPTLAPADTPLDFIERWRKQRSEQE
jgi:hypothetical protein